MSQVYVEQENELLHIELNLIKQESSIKLLNLLCQICDSREELKLLDKNSYPIYLTNGKGGNCQCCFKKLG